MSTEPLTFVLPRTHSAISGGNLYNAQLLAALEARGVEGGRELYAIEVDQWLSMPPTRGIYLVDSLNLAEFRELLARRVEGQRFVLLLHHLPSLEPDLAADDPALCGEQETLAAFDAFVATSAFAADYVRSRGKGQPIATIEPVIRVGATNSPDFLRPVRALMSCNLIPRKGVLEFLEELAHGAKATDAYRLDIVGRTDLHADYAASCESILSAAPKLAARVQLRGAAPYDTMRQWYGAANLFLSASRMETFGISLQEARQYGLPVFAVRGGNSHNHVSAGETGELFATPRALAEGFVALARAPERLPHYGAHALAHRPTTERTWGDAAASLLQSLQEWFPC